MRDFLQEALVTTALFALLVAAFALGIALVGMHW